MITTNQFILIIHKSLLFLFRYNLLIYVCVCACAHVLVYDIHTFASDVFLNCYGLFYELGSLSPPEMTLIQTLCTPDPRDPPISTSTMQGYYLRAAMTEVSMGSRDSNSNLCGCISSSLICDLFLILITIICLPVIKLCLTFPWLQ